MTALRTPSAGRDTGLSESAARRIAQRAHEGQYAANGEPMIAHVGRVAAAVPPVARPVAWLHDVMEHSTVDESVLLDAGASADQCLALQLLTRDIGQDSDGPYMEHVRAIALAPGSPGRIARAVKRADLLDHISHPSIRPDRWRPPHRAALVVLTTLS